MKVNFSHTTQEVLATVPSAVQTGLFLYIDAAYHTGFGPAIFAGEAVGGVVYAGARALEHMGVLRSKAVRVMATTAISVVLGGMAGAAEAGVAGESIIAGMGRGVISGYVTGLTLSSIAPSSERPAPNDTTDPNLTVDLSHPDQSSPDATQPRPEL